MTLPDPRSTDGKIATILGTVELALADTPRAATQHDMLEWVIGRLQARLPGLKAQIAAENRRTPAPRKPTPPPEPAWSREPTRKHSVKEIAAIVEGAERDAEQRDTPVAFEPGPVRNNHPDRER